MPGNAHHPIINADVVVPAEDSPKVPAVWRCDRCHAHGPLKVGASYEAIVDSITPAIAAGVARPAFKASGLPERDRETIVREHQRVSPLCTGDLELDLSKVI